MPQNDMHLLFQQMGEVLSGIRGLHDTIDIRQAQAEQLHDLVRQDIAVLRRDQRELEEKFDCAAFIAQHDIEGLRASSNENSRLVEGIAHAVDALRRPIVELTMIRSRVTAFLFIIGILGSCSVWLAEPVYRWFIDATLQRH